MVSQHAWGIRRLLRQLELRDCQGLAVINVFTHHREIYSETKSQKKKNIQPDLSLCLSASTLHCVAVTTSILKQDALSNQ